MPAPAIKLTQATQDAWVTRLCEAYTRATNDQKVRGILWYYVAHNFAHSLAKRYKLPSLEEVCGIISALSPGVSWERNMIEAEAYISGHATIRYTTYKANVEKARLILGGESVERVLDPNLSPNKTLCFYRQLLDPNNTATVTVDRHILAALGWTAKLTPLRYAAIYRAFQRAQVLLAVPFQVIQPVIWTAQREASPATDSEADEADTTEARTVSLLAQAEEIS